MAWIRCTPNLQTNLPPSVVPSLAPGLPTVTHPSSRKLRHRQWLLFLPAAAAGCCHQELQRDDAEQHDEPQRPPEFLVAAQRLLDRLGLCGGIDIVEIDRRQQV